MGEAAEYLIPLEELQEGRRVRLEVAYVLRQFRIQNITNKYEAEKSASQQNFEVRHDTLSTLFPPFTFLIFFRQSNEDLRHRTIVLAK